VEALQRRLPVEHHAVHVFPGQNAWLDWLRRRYPHGDLLPDPWLLVGAGHATQLPMLAARHDRGGRAVVLMTPVLPTRLFDLCLVPEHDRPRAASNVRSTRGSLNRVRAVAPPGGDGHGLLLIGGTSRHYRWHSGKIIEQVLAIVRYSSQRRWTLATSRRTPAGFAEQVRRAVFSNTLTIEVVPWHETSPGWLQARYAAAGCVWVTGDSVSMLYEALTAGLPTGVIELPPRRNGRIVRGVRELIRSRQVTPFHDWIRGCPLRRPDQTFDEANRCADWISSHWA
jgi:mitochondrial fission protein ELM1